MFDRELLFVSGKGGVGKSAVAAALALVAARMGKKVLLVALTDLIGLAHHLATEALTYKMREIRPGVWALAIERHAALDEYLKIQLHTPRGAPTAALSKALNILADAAPGIREIITIGKPIYEVWQGDWDLVIADAPPVGQLRSYLQAPATIAGLVPAGRIREQADKMANLMADESRSGLMMVTTAEELPISETGEELARLAEDKLVPVVGVIVNRLLAPLLVGETVHLDELPPGPLRDAAALHSGLVDSQIRFLDGFHHDIAIPYLFGVHTPGEVTARIADHLEPILVGGL